jgi:hypothetical protein
LPALLSNFNNFTLVYLLTAGGPKMMGGGIAGETDLLVTYTFNLAFRDSGTNYGGQRYCDCAVFHCRCPGLAQSPTQREKCKDLNMEGNHTPARVFIDEYRMKPLQKLKLRKALAHTRLICCVGIVLIPYLMVIVASLRKDHFPPSTLWVRPDQWSFEHWKFVLGIPYQEIANPATGELRTIQASTPPLLWLWNSILISSCSSCGIILSSGTAAYAFARIRFKFRNQILIGLLIL